MIARRLLQLPVILLVVYTLVNASLWKVKRQDVEPPPQVTLYPKWLPVTGMTACAAFLLFQLCSLLWV